jgi:hypothetical protein
LNLQATEHSVREAMHRVGSAFLEKLLSRDPGHRGHQIDCGHGHQAIHHLAALLQPERPLGGVLG